MEAVIVVLFAAFCLIAITYYAKRHQRSKRPSSLTDDSDSTAMLNTALLGGDTNCPSHSHGSHGHHAHHGDIGSHHSGVDSGHVDTGHFDGGHFDGGGHH